MKKEKDIDKNIKVSRGLRHLAEQGILHRDIALRNILLTNNDVVKVVL